MAGLLWAKFVHLRFGNLFSGVGEGVRRGGSDEILFMYHMCCQYSMTMIVCFFWGFLLLFLGQFSQPLFAAVEI